MAALSAGSSAPEIQVSDWCNSGPLSLAMLRDKVVVVEFWATWCGPCRTSIPHLNQIQRQYKDKNVVVIGLTDEPKSKVGGFVNQNMQYAVGCGSPTFQSYGVRGIPAAFIVTNGTIAWAGHPGDLEGALDSTLRSFKPASIAAAKAAPLEIPLVRLETPAVAAATAPRIEKPAVAFLINATFRMKDGRSIKTVQALENGDEWAIKDVAGGYKMLKKNDVTEVIN